MPLSNSELAQKLDDTINGWQGFVLEQTRWLASVNATEDITDPDTLVILTVKTPFQLQKDYDDLLIGPTSELAQATQLLADAQTALTDAQNAQAIFDSYDTTFQGYLSLTAADVTSSATNAGLAGDGATEAQNWANSPEDVLVPEGDLLDDYSALHWSIKSADSAAAAAVSEAAALVSEAAAAASAAAALVSETAAGVSESAADASAIAALASETAAAASESAAAGSESASAASAASADADAIATAADAASTAADAIATAADALAADASAVAAAASAAAALASETAAAASESVTDADAIAAAASADKSEDFAITPEDVVVPGEAAGTYSALHWAAKAAASVAQNLVELSDVDDTGLTDGFVLYWDNTAGLFKFQANGSAPVDSVAGKTGVVTLVEADITDLGTYAVVGHSHVIADVTGLQTELDGKALSGHTHGINDLTDVLLTAPAALHALMWDSADSRFENRLLVESDISDFGTYALASHNHDAAYAALSHSHVIADVTGLQAALDGKAASSHTHVIADTTGLQAALDGKAASGHTHALNALSDVNVATPTDGHILQWDNGLSEFNLVAPSGGGGSWTSVTAAHTLAAGEQIACYSNGGGTGYSVSAPVTLAADDFFVVSNIDEGDLITLARNGHTLQLAGVDVADDVTIAVGEQIVLIARSASILEIIQGN